MKRTEALDAIRKLLFDEDKKFAEAKLADGTIIQWDGDLVEGVALNVVAEDGNVTPAPDGTHELEDGTKINTVGGLVTSVEQKETETEVEVEMATEFEKLFAKHLEDFNKVVAEFNDLKAKVEGFESKFTEITQTVEDSTKSADEKFSKIVEIVEKISETPAVEPEPVKHVLFKKISDKSRTAVELFKELDKQTRKG